MNKIYSACDPAQLQLALSQTLDAQSEQQLTEHLSGCEICRSQLAQFAGGESFWSRATNNLAAAPDVETSTDEEFHSSVLCEWIKTRRSLQRLNSERVRIFKAELNCRSTRRPIRKC